MVQFENTMRVRANNQNDNSRSFDINADVEYNRETEKMRIFSSNVRTTENENVASFSKADTLSINYYDLDKQSEVNEAINAFIAEVEEKTKNINL
jgi:hypothetical protein